MKTGQITPESSLDPANVNATETKVHLMLDLRTCRNTTRLTMSNRTTAKLGLLVCRSMTAALLMVLTRSYAVADPAVGATDQANSGSTQYGPFGWLDHRSSYGQGPFPEPFLVDDSDGEENEARLDWFRTEGPNQSSAIATAEVEKGFGPLTLEVEVPYERDASTSVDPTTGRTTSAVVQGLSNIDLGARCPVFEYVSPDEAFDLTGGAAVEVGVPTNSPVSQNAEVVPKLFADLRLGAHFTLQSVLGYSRLYGGGPDGGLRTFEYGFVFGYSISHRQLSLPGVLQWVPVFELSGATQENQDDPGFDRLLGNLGFRLNLKAVGSVQPRLGLGYVFPIDRGARESVRQGVVTSLVFEY